MTHEMLQQYWWFIMSVLGALLVFMLFVQGGQSMIASTEREKRPLLINSLGPLWPGVKIIVPLPRMLLPSPGRNS